MSKQAMKLALEALQKCDSALAEELAAWDIDPPLHHVLEASNACGPAVTALREALAEQPAQQALDKMAENARELGLDYGPAQQEPVAWMYQCSADRSGPVLMQHKRDWAESGSGLWTETPLYTAPQAQPAQRKPLSNEVRENLMKKAWSEWLTMKDDDDHSFAWHFLFARHFSFEVEAAHNITGEKK